MKTSLINDGQSLKSASRNGYPIKTYDDGFGELFIHRDSMGISGIVRAKTWEDAYGICEDEFLPEADETVEEMEKEYSTQHKSGRELWEHKKGPLMKDWTWSMLSEAGRMMWLNKPGEDVPFDSRDGGFINHPYWQETYGFRPNGPNATDTIKHGIYAKDLNGDSLEPLTPELLKELEIVLEIEDVD